MWIVYLDQNKWIELARVAYGKRTDPGLTNVLEFIRYARALHLACFPLSFVHYMETQTARDLGRRVRLAGLMWEISGGLTIVDPGRILRHELDEALYARFPYRVRPDHIEPLQLLGQGVSHAGPRPLPRISLPEGLPLRAKEAIEELFEKGMLSGVSPFTGEAAPGWDSSGPETRFQDHLNTLAQRLENLDEQTRERAHYAIKLVDILDPLNEALSRHGISWDDIAALGAEGLTAFVDDLPSQRADVHLHRHWSKNRQLKTTRTLLSDWGQLGPMVMYCDVVVTEKLFADLINRGNLQKRAIVMTDLRQLPPVVIEGSRSSG